jgi:hypothetical protein
VDILRQMMEATQNIKVNIDLDQLLDVLSEMEGKAVIWAHWLPI